MLRIIDNVNVYSKTEKVNITPTSGEPLIAFFTVTILPLEMKRFYRFKTLRYLFHYFIRGRKDPQTLVSFKKTNK